MPKSYLQVKTNDLHIALIFSNLILISKPAVPLFQKMILISKPAVPLFQKMPWTSLLREVKKENIRIMKNINKNQMHGSNLVM